MSNGPSLSPKVMFRWQNSPGLPNRPPPAVSLCGFARCLQKQGSARTCVFVWLGARRADPREPVARLAGE